MEQLNRLTRSLRRARTVELPDGEPAAGLGPPGAGLGELRGVGETNCKQNKRPH